MGGYYFVLKTIITFFLSCSLDRSERISICFQQTWPTFLIAILVENDQYWRWVFVLVLANGGLPRGREMLVRVCQKLILITKINYILWVVGSRYIYPKIMSRVAVQNRLCTTDLQDEGFDNSIVELMVVISVMVVASAVVVFAVCWSGFADNIIRCTRI